MARHGSRPVDEPGTTLARGEHVATFALSPEAPPRGIRGKLRRVSRGKHFRDTAWTMVGELTGMVSQFGTLVLIARAFSDRKDVYGLFAATIAFMNVISPFTTIGMGYVLLQRVAGENADPDRESGKAWSMIVLGGLAGVLFGLATSWLLLPRVPLMVIVALALGELVFTQITYTGKFIAQALDRPATGTQVVATVWVLRLVAAVAYVAITPRATLAGWSYFHMGVSLVGAVLTVLALNRLLYLNPRLGLARGIDVKRGLGYSLTVGASYLKNDADKTLLASFHKYDAAGLYALAYKVITPLYLPVRSLSDTTFARFFREGAQSATDTYRLARRTTLVGAGMALGGGIVVAAAAPLLPLVLSDRWDSAVRAAQWLAFVPVLVALQIYAFNALMGLGRQKWCLWVTVLASMLNLGLNLALIPRYDWRGSTIATILSEAASVLALWALLHHEATVRSPAREHLRSL